MSDWLLVQCVSGRFFFAGNALVILSVCLASSRIKWVSRFSLLISFIGVLLVTVSSTPVIAFLDWLALGIWFCWIFFERRKLKLKPVIVQRSRVAVAISALLLICLEAPYHFSPRVSISREDSIAVVGDSVSAGIGEETTVWPEIVENSLKIDVDNFSQAGATAGKALLQAESLNTSHRVLLIEIGGNDLLGIGSPEQFYSSLNQLLEKCTRYDRHTLMFELPLPPFCNEYGRIQRRLAVRHNVQLIPKARFAEVLRSGGATIDSIHLSDVGHQSMAKLVCGLIEVK
ncbi:SGNH/GDSL hydrolase family protein [Calycomorphotria hydatis]|uniref:Acyl-CoA thioesterase I n=1 Tax=Calycomorphotria hydatis TaxID=2528027 RepID=A0A517TBY3_9PLAN|nr:GDSL-type esterase/lipase family protein [Calycomorphotria hydatis]QDT65869.1 Acyl-CoA thioesterase I precursor [Calycomorphotria hydatis]